MTSIDTALPSYTPPPVSSAAPVAPVSTPPTSASNDSAQPVTPPPPLTNSAPTNANPSAPAIYTALAAEASSTIRGTSVNTTV